MSGPRRAALASVVIGLLVGAITFVVLTPRSCVQYIRPGVMDLGDGDFYKVCETYAGLTIRFPNRSENGVLKVRGPSGRPVEADRDAAIIWSVPTSAAGFLIGYLIIRIRQDGLDEVLSSSSAG